MLKNNNRISLAIAEDCAFTRMLFELTMLSFKDLQILHLCDNGIDLLESLERSEILPAFCIVDLHMPLLDGQMTMKTIRTKFPGIKLFGYTSSECSEEINRLYKMGAEKVFSKCDPPGTILKSIVECL